ncbi:hypothetical protein [Chitinophaga sp. XS-30]|uniref:hypothetical protein n=1 Tax=Chitinophaga sp. XS-30 TaxID=2604421 RepID=UPI0011DE274C|nr:hypothetical protein [Chitinophaga sp. XS-30]QEH40706.1 hypothetical protein FW415_07390 [Chitinophaga sp. XS-30]
MLKQDKLSLGILLGLLAPVAALFIYYLVTFMPRSQSLSDFFTMLKQNRHLLPKLISICLLANGVVFYLYTRKRRDQTARGIFLITMLYAIVILLLKIIR